MNTKWTTAIFLLLFAPTVWAEDPGRGVARISLTNGDITMQRGDSGDWIAAAVNAPMVTGDKIYAARASRAEVQFDWANFLRLGENTEVRLADIEGRRYQLQVSRGVITYSILRDSTADVELNTPALAVRPLKHGVYRIHVMENGETEITVRDGKAEISSRQGTEVLQEGRTLIARLGPTDNEVQVQELHAAAKDDWDRWNERRDDQLKRSGSYRYVHTSVYGAEDLDDYGYWTTVPSYGPVWYPRVAAGWSPYSYGRWAWIDWYGWTWVGYEPWGWAPYHYGRWFFRGGYGWGWCPGPVVYNPWAPALVGFFGFGHHVGVGVGFGFGSLGWVPLAPGERFYPWYGRGYYGRGGNVTVNNVNITNVTNITNVYRNAGVNGAIRSVNVQDFGRGSVVNAQRVNAGDIRKAGQIRGMIPAVPDRQSLRMTDREARAGSIPQNTGRDRFFTRQQPRQVERVPFQEQQQQLTRSVRAGGGFEDRRGANPAANTPVVSPDGRGSIRALGESSAAPGAQVNPQANTGRDTGRGWRVVGEDRRNAPTGAAPNPAAQAAPAPQPAQPSVRSEGNSGWRRLGDQRRNAPAAAVAPSANPTAPAASPAPGPALGNDRRLRDERRNAPAAAPAPSSDRNVDRGNDWRRLGDERRNAPAAAPAPAPARRNEARPESPRSREVGPSPWFGRQSNSELQQRRNNLGDSGPGNMGRSERQLEIHRPVTVERAAPRHDGGGGHAAPAPRSESRGDRGGSRSGDGGGPRSRR
ncbi:MAG: FecR domain-containing protein [Acidobacteria bacterium]|nr:FecR domain-containing protein [Acidobacteriota bacterium]